MIKPPPDQDPSIDGETDMCGEARFILDLRSEVDITATVATVPSGGRVDRSLNSASSSLNAGSHAAKLKDKAADKRPRDEWLVQTCLHAQNGTHTRSLRDKVRCFNSCSPQKCLSRWNQNVSQQELLILATSPGTLAHTNLYAWKHGHVTSEFNAMRTTGGQRNGDSVRLVPR